MECVDVTADWIKNVLSYDPETGHFVWLRRFGKRGVPGRRAGTVDFGGYVVVTINGKRHKGHRLAWLVMTGSWPAVAIDHINGNRQDNRFCNLRAADWGENQQNRQRSKNNSSGYLGVSWDSHAGKWRANIAYGGKSRNLGGYDDPAAAHEAYLKAKASLHKFNPVPRNA